MFCPICGEEMIIDEDPNGNFPVWYCLNCRRYFSELS